MNFKNAIIFIIATIIIIMGLGVYSLNAFLKSEDIEAEAFFTGVLSDELLREIKNDLEKIELKDFADEILLIEEI